MTNFHKRSTCRLCEKSNLVSVLKLEPTPPANAFVSKEESCVKQQYFPLDVYFCENCHHVQLLDIVDPKILFENYVYVSGTSPVFVKHFDEYAKSILTKYPQSHNLVIVDIGSNDGTFLRSFKNLGYKVLGVDPAKKIAVKATKEGIETINEFFTMELSEKIKKKYGTAAILTANNVFAHMDDLKNFIKSVKNLLSSSGIFVFEVSYLVDVIENTLFDMTYHEHLSYHAVKPLISFFEKNGFELIETVRTDTHGGSLRGIVQLQGGAHKVDESVRKCIDLEDKMELNKVQTYEKFERKIAKQKEKIRSLLLEIKSKDQKIAGLGAPAKATTLMHHFEIDSNYIDFIIDDNPLKQGLFSPGMHIPVVSSNWLEEKKPDYLVILAWNFAESLMKKYSDFHDKGGKFIIPLPELMVK